MKKQPLDISEELITCPLSKKIFADPVSVPGCSHTFERDVISKFSDCPECTKKDIKTIVRVDKLQQNRMVSELVKEYLHKYPDMIAELYISDQHVLQMVKTGDKENLVPFLKLHPDMLNRFYESKVGESSTRRYTILHWAVELENLEMVKALVENFSGQIDMNARGACCDTRYLGNITPIATAVRNNKSPQILSYLIMNGGDPSIPDMNNCSPLLTACKQLQYEHIKCLLDSGKPLNINLVQKTLAWTERASSLALTAIVPFSIDMFAALLANKEIDVNERNSNGYAVLHTIAMCNDVNALKLLLAKPGTDVDVLTKLDMDNDRHAQDGKTALQIAQENQCKEVALLLGFYCLASDWLKGKPISPLSSLECLNLSMGDLKVMVQCLESKGFDKHKLEILQATVEELAKSQVRFKSYTQLRMFADGNDMNSTFEKAKMSLYNYLFEIGHQNKGVKHSAWEVKIRQTAWWEFNSSLTRVTDEEKARQLEWAREQPVFHEHRNWYGLGRTNAVIAIDKMLDSVKEILHRPALVL